MMSRRPTVLLVIPHLGGGGAERVTAQVSSGLDPARFDVHLALMTQRDGAGYALPSWVTVHGLGARRVRSGAWRLLRLVRRLRPDVMLTGMVHLNLLALFLRPLFPRKTRLIVRQNGSVAAIGAGGWFRALYPKADAIICQTHGMAVEVARAAGLRSNTHVLPNPVDFEAIRAIVHASPNRWTGPGPHLLAAGRLAPEKGFDLLLPALGELRRRFPAIDLTILGEGRERPALEMLAWVLGLRGAVRFTGEVEQPASWYPGATLFVLASRHEGLPNALLEAAAGGLPIVATPACEGLVEMLNGQPGAWVAEETTAKGIAAAIEDGLQSVGDGERFSHRWVEAYRKDRAIAAYEALIEAQLAGTH